jgi:hypothetical protein
MNDDQLNQLFQAARGSRPDTSRAEYGFETRLLAALRENRERAMPWAALVWRLMPVFAAIVVITGAWSYSVQSQTTAEAALGAGEEGALASLTGGD